MPLEKKPELTANQLALSKIKPLIQVKNGKPVTNTWVIAQACGRKHSDVTKDLKALITKGYVNEAEFSLIKLKDSRGREQDSIELNESGFLVAMPYICGRRGLEGQRALVDEFLRLKQKAAGFGLLTMTQKQQASEAGRGLANFRWKNPVFVFQLNLPGLEGK